MTSFLRFSSSHMIHFIRSLSFHGGVYAYFFLALLRLVKTFEVWVVVPTILEASSPSSFRVEGTSGCSSRYSVLKKVPLQFLCAQISVVLFNDSQETWLLTVLNVWFFSPTFQHNYKMFEKLNVKKLSLHRIWSLSEKLHAHDDTHAFGQA